ncbi:hypothetical protein MRB53_033335 [Persea americana]|uniref:Uncharacterized protein n=1 Tax=Persea americana TaxID=3435 RepID=A0ACC2KUR6_PERAE|nr:hypothetical protein MRB53_033335 [Persea americana]
MVGRQQLEYRIPLFCDNRKSDISKSLNITCSAAFSDCHFHHLHKQTAIQVIWIEGGEEEEASERKGKRVSGFWVVLELEWLIRQSSEEKPKKSV